jgi:hypothetical protein
MVYVVYALTSDFLLLSFYNSKFHGHCNGQHHDIRGASFGIDVAWPDQLCLPGEWHGALCKKSPPRICFLLTSDYLPFALYNSKVHGHCHGQHPKARGIVSFLLLP